jgi:guanylate kinase
MLAVFLGPSGAGKSTTIAAVREKCPNLESVVSYTTKSPKATDRDGEYDYLTPEEFAAMDLSGQFAWTEPTHGHRYGTRKSDLAAVAASDEWHFITIAPPDLLTRLSDFADERLAIFWIQPPSEDELFRRLREEAHLDELEARRRIADGKQWAMTMQRLAATMRVNYIPHDTVENRVMQVLSCL